METINLSAQTRTITGKKVKKLRKQGIIPAILYGQGKKGENISLDLNNFVKIYHKAGGSSLVDIKVDDKNPIKVLIQEPQYDPITDKPIHVDLYKIKMDEELTTQIPLEFIGIAPAVKELEGNLIKNKNEVEVKCLPANLIPKIQVDISILKTFDDSILIKDLKVPPTIKIQDREEETVALVNPPISEEELKTMEEEAAADTEKEGIEKIQADAETEKAAKEEEKTQGAQEGKIGEKPADAKPQSQEKPSVEKK